MACSSFLLLADFCKGLPLLVVDKHTKPYRRYSTLAHPPHMPFSAHLGTRLLDLVLGEQHVLPHNRIILPQPQQHRNSNSCIVRAQRAKGAAMQTKHTQKNRRRTFMSASFLVTFLGFLEVV
jgi:hypothetical protein